ncbi:MAG: DUF6452 family protein [Bacteroidota bacterium]
MRKIGLFFLTLLTIAFFTNCEKDDICVDGDTPLLVIRFFDANNPTEFQDVPDLEVIALNPDNTVLDTIANASLDSIAIPLRIEGNTTTFILSQNLTSTDDTTINRDTLTFNYETMEVFISRACGFVANYDDLTDNLTLDDDNWIQEIQTDTLVVENSASAHVQIFH